MWLPTPVYKSLPALYAFFGVFFIFGALYLGLETPSAPMYVGLGLASILASFTVSMWRARSKGEPESVDPTDTYTS